jgi:hypothetical protein
MSVRNGQLHNPSWRACDLKTHESEIGSYNSSPNILQVPPLTASSIRNIPIGLASDFIFISEFPSS